MSKKALLLVSSLGIVLVASCSSSGGAGGDAGPLDGGPPATGAAKSLFDGIILPPGAEERGDAPEDSTISVPMGSSTGSPPGEIQPGGIMNVSIPFTSPGGNVVGAGIRFSPSGPFKFIPVKAAQGQTGGTLAFQFQAPPQSSLCGNLSSICHSIKCYEFAVTSAGTISRANITDLAVKCGNCTEPSCQSLLQSCKLDAGDAGDAGEAGTCSSVQTAGGDAPETRTVEMGKTSGTFVFTWDMNTIQDRMIVSYNGATLHDTGCVSNGSSKSLTFNGASSKITVSVQPNCAGGTSGTAWSFTVGCPQ